MREEKVMGGEVSFNTAGLSGLSKPTAVCTLCSDNTVQTRLTISTISCNADVHLSELHSHLAPRQFFSPFRLECVLN